MNKKEVIKGLDKISEGIEILRNVFSADTEDVVTSAPVAEVEPTNSELPALYDIEDLKKMKYNEFKKYAATLGVKCTGTRAEIMDRVLEALNKENTDTEEVTVAPPVDDVPEEKPQKKSGKKKSSDTELSTGDTKDVSKADSDTADEYDEQAREIADETPVEAIVAALKDVGIKATKKTAVKKLAEALREGLIEVDDEDEDDEEVEEAPEVVEVEDEEEFSSNSYFSEYDPDGLNNPDEMSEERAEAIVEKVDEILTAYSEGELTDEDISDYVGDNATEDEVELLGDDYDEEEVLKLYIELIKRTIDNDGEEHEPSDPYEVGEEDLCCGHILKYVKKSKKYVCEICGTEYEAE